MTRVIGHGNCFRNLHLGFVISRNHKEQWSPASLILPSLDIIDIIGEQMNNLGISTGRPLRPGEGSHSSKAYRFEVSNLAEGRAGGCLFYGAFPQGVHQSKEI
jgi:hypothetical protein